MADLSISAMLIRFFLGGIAVVVSTIIAKKSGEKIGGIFAAFPAVYLAALLTANIDLNGNELITHSILLSKGAIFGMAINILIAIAAGYFLKRNGWKRGFVQTILCWLFVSIVVAVVVSY